MGKKSMTSETESGARVTLLEAGPKDRHPWIHIPAGMIKLLQNQRLVNWGYATEPEKGANDRIPTNDATWAINIDNAAQIVEAANLLMTEGRARDPNGPWMKYAIALNKAGVAGMAAATAHDHDKTNDAGSAMYDACFQCHGRYIPRPKDSLYKHNIDEDLKAAGKTLK